MILALNIGTSSWKIASYDSSPELKEIKRETVHPGSIIDGAAALSQWNIDTAQAVGFRIVHGGDRLIRPTVITDEVLNYLISIQGLAPLHNPPVIECIQMLRNKYPSLPFVGVFDTSFHHTMPEKAKRYAIPKNWEDSFQVKRYGFHGLAYQSMLDMYCHERQLPVGKATIIAMQLGSGCSICAIKDGQSVDTSMGFSPLEGLISRTRSGDVDAAVIPYLARKMNKSASEIIDLFNHETGLKGLGGYEGDMGKLLAAAEEEDIQAVAAVELFIYRIQKYIGAYDAVLGGADAFILGGGISEHCPEIWKGLFNNPYFGVSLDTLNSGRLQHPFACVTTNSSKRPAFIAHVDEEKEITKGVITTLTSER